MNNTFERVINLKQETHLVHFQIKRGDAENKRISPTLRASEVKPQLDKEIVKYLERIKVDKKEYKEWLAYNSDEKNNKDFCALNYKMSITANYDEDNMLLASYSFNDKNNPKNNNNLKYLLFTNFDTKNNSKQEFILSLYKDTKITLKSLVTKKIKFEFNGVDKEWNLLEFVSEFLNYFLVVYSFGYRQLKCFGTYNTCDNKDDLEKIKYASKIFNDKKIIAYKITSGLKLNGFYKLVKNYIAFVRECKKNSKFVSYFNLGADIKNRKCLRKLFGLSEIVDENEKLLEGERYPSPLSFKKYGNYVLLVVDKDLIGNIPNLCVYRTTDKMTKREIHPYPKLKIRDVLLKMNVNGNSEYERINLAYENVVTKAFVDTVKNSKDKINYERVM